MLERGSGAAVIPLLGALALGAQRLLPALQQVYSSWCALTSFNAAMESVLAMLNSRCRQVKLLIFWDCMRASAWTLSN